jgi:hypothetical protein
MSIYVILPETPNTTHIPGYRYLMIVVSINYKLKLYNII